MQGKQYMSLCNTHTHPASKANVVGTKARYVDRSIVEVLRIQFLLDPAPEQEPLPKELELELLESGSLLKSDPPMESALFWVCTSLILIQEAPSV